MKPTWLGVALLTVVLSACEQQINPPDRGPECSPGYSASVSPSQINGSIDVTVQLTFEVTDCTGTRVPNSQTTWVSADPSIATVDADGLVTTQAVGNTQIVVADQELFVGAVVDVAVAQPDTAP